MARVLVRAVHAFDDVPRGAEAWVEETDRVRGLINRGAFVVLQREPKPKRKPKVDAELGEESGDGAPGPEHP